MAWLWISAQLAILIALVALVLLRAEPTTVVGFVVTPPPPPATVAPRVIEPVRTPVTPTAPSEPAAPARPACPAPVRDAPRADPHAFPDDVTHAVASPSDARWLAAWDDDHVWMSKDGGGSFTRVLDGPRPVTDVAFDCFGDLIVLRGTQVGVRTEREAWHDVPSLATDESGHPALIGGGPEVLLVGSADGANSGRALLVRSADLGATWTFRDLDAGFESGRTTGRQDGDGTIHLVVIIGDCMNDPMSWITLRGDRRDADEATSAWSHVAYARGDVIYGDGYWRKRGSLDWKPLEGLPAEAGAELVGGAALRVVAKDALYRLEDGRAKRIGKWPEDAEPATVDAAGRVWGLTKHGEQEARGLRLVR